ncbi:MAG: two component transcriptional regulator, winged helix family [Paenibacillus sp.]|jgi:DNA-binding response OmpR family regulator|nr:two component transcriptional regulator, winged helix family [Paenibacillus sp.]
MDPSILLIEDDPDIGELVALYLRREQYRIDIATDAEQGLSLFRQNRYDLLISDIMLPGMDGLELVKSIRRLSNIPIIFLTSKKTSHDVITGLKVGGDDYVTKPFEPEILVARVQAGLRRFRTAIGHGDVERGQVWRDGWLTVYKDRLEVFVDNKLIAMPAKEFQLLLLLLNHPGQVFPMSLLYETIWGLDGTSEERTVTVHIHSLRKRIERDPANPEYIVTVRGFGYKFGKDR